MYFSNGLINIKNILVISLLFSLSLSVVFLNNYIIKWNPEIAADEKYKGKLKTTEVYFHCNRDFHYFLESNIEKRSQIHKQLKKICEKIYFDHDNSSIYYFEPDSLTYITSLNKFLLIDKLRNEIIEEHNAYQLNEIIKQRSLDFQSFFLNGELDLLSDHGKKLLFLRYLEQTDIKAIENVKILSYIYKLFFNELSYTYFFIVGLNFLVLIVTIFFISLTLKLIFPNLTNIMFLLISLNVFSLPFFIIYYLSFYKEPIILLSFVILIYNFVCFYLRKVGLKSFILLTILIFFAFTFILNFKYEYIVLFFLSQILAFVILVIKKQKIFYFLFFLQMIMIGFYISNPNYIMSLLPKNIDKIEADKYISAVSENKKENRLTPSQIEQFYSDTHRYIYKNVGTLYFSEPNPEKVSVHNYIYLECYKINLTFCKKLNNFLHKISSIKRATLSENFFFDKNKKNNNNLINAFEYDSALSVLKQIPLSVLKGFYMPILFNSQKHIIIFSIFKLMIFLSLMYAFYHLLRNKKYRELLLMISIFMLFVPLLLSVDLITSNFHTYMRYTFPYNVVLSLILISYFISSQNFIRNDKYSN